MSGERGTGGRTPGGVSRMGAYRDVHHPVRPGGSYGNGEVVMAHARMVASTVHGSAPGGDGGAGGVLAIDGAISDPPG